PVPGNGNTSRPCFRGLVKYRCTPSSTIFPYTTLFRSILFKMLKRRENLGSTGIGRGIAIPHCRSPVVNRLRVAFGRKPEGAAFEAIDGQPDYNFVLIVAPPLEVSNQYLPVLGEVAQVAKEPDVPKPLQELRSPDEFLELIAEKSR